MLSTEQLKLPLIFYHWCSQAGLLILNVNYKEGEIEIRTDKLQVRIWRFLISCIFCRGLYAVSRFISLGASTMESIPLEDVPLFVGHSLGHFAAIYFISNAYLLQPQITCFLFNTLNEGQVRKTTWKNLTLQEAVVLLTPVNLSVLILMYIGMLYLSPKAAYNLYSSVSKELENEYTKFACVMVEAIIGGFGILNILSDLTVVVLHLQKCIEEGESNVKLLRNPNIQQRRLSQIVRNIRQLQLQAKLHNEAYRYSNFFAKIAALFGFTLMEAFGILLLRENVSKFAYIYILFGFECSLFYCALFHNAFKLPVLVGKSKTRLRNLVKKNVLEGEERASLLAKIRSLPVVSIKSGDFTSFERMSTPNFFGFAAFQVIRVLIGYRKHK